MAEPVILSLPPSRQALASLQAGDEVLLDGVAFTARDATHVRIAEELRRTGELPFGLAGQVLFYAGPTPAAAGRPAGAVGPTTARRMDAWTPAMLDAGIAATIGKGSRSPEVAEACKRNGAVYLAAVGGAAALLARRVTAIDVVAYPDLGTEALARVTFDRFPAFVAIDAAGNDLYAEAAGEWACEPGDAATAGRPRGTAEGEPDV